ncbi:MAG: hypothetical protein HY706_13170 [Candidatus Hydrogenedentes bacterium]|nr:hypothetical protein [Candidatus Hydrogenedentota bacterium]
MFTSCLFLGAFLFGSEDNLGNVSVVSEEDVYSFVNPNNGSGPLWSFGCTSIARLGERVFVSAMETGEGVPPLSNTRWRLLERHKDGWRMVSEAKEYRQREPCSLATVSDNRLFLYVNDSQMPPGTHYGRCEPHLLFFDVSSPPFAWIKLMPYWGSQPTFTDHSYRGFAADRNRGELLMLNIDAKTSIQHWCLLTRGALTLRNGSVSFPIRACYPQVALKNRAGYILAIGDIVEPVEEWRKYKFEQTQREWDYVFRILYFTWTPDLMTQDFAPPIEIANVDATGGYITNQDLWIAPNGDAYIMYTERAVQSELLRDRFFPGKSTISSLYLAVVRDGKIIERRVLIEGSASVEPGTARFHVAPKGNVWAVIYLGGPSPSNVLMQVYPAVSEKPVPIPLRAPFSNFCLATVRAGNRPSNTLDILGTSTSDNTMSYAEVRLKTEG